MPFITEAPITNLVLSSPAVLQAPMEQIARRINALVPSTDFQAGAALLPDQLQNAHAFVPMSFTRDSTAGQSFTTSWIDFELAGGVPPLRIFGACGFSQANTCFIRIMLNGTPVTGDIDVNAALAVFDAVPFQVWVKRGDRIQLRGQTAAGVTATSVCCTLFCSAALLVG